MLLKIAPYLLFGFYKLLFWSWRIKIIETEYVKKARENNEPFIIAHWHGDELGILHLLKPYHVACIISTSKDGELMNKIVQLLGAKTARGSSTRGGTGALKGTLRLAKEGRRPSFAVDGPKGPIYKVKPGVLQICRLTKLPIVPISFHASRFHLFEKSWNQSRLPLPFSKITIRWGEKMQAVTKEQEAKSDELASHLENLLNDN
ncbi:MAG: lysophospholipid acyltransferase family protein, partial [Bdellovibrionales bacterium]|nr:lysophospholipid acyltransferase family protein [Bdellovibrionales bacterium]